MNNSMPFFIPQFTAVSGLAIWLTVVAVNNTLAFKNGVFAMGMLMNMTLFDTEPRIVTPLLSRRVENPAWHRRIYTFVLALEIVTAALLLFAAMRLGVAVLGLSDAAAAVGSATLALTALLGTSIVMLIGGAWFVYYIRQEGTQITHFALIGVALAGLILTNLH